MKTCSNCGSKGTKKCADCKTGNPPSMWAPKKVSE